MKDYIRSIVESIRKLREEREMTQEELAVLAGISHSHLSKIEVGSRTIGMKTYVRLLDALGAAPILMPEIDRIEKHTELLARFICILEECSETELRFFMDTLESMKDNVDKLKSEGEKTKLQFPNKLYRTCSSNKMNGKWVS